MSGLNWNDPQTIWLNLTNLALGIVTLIAVGIAVGGVAWELVLKHRRAREEAGLDSELKAMFDGASPHLIAMDGLGLTMADGGEPIQPPAAAPAKDKASER